MDETTDDGCWPMTEQLADIEQGLPQWMVPVRRRDDVGLLAWRLTGPKPDVTVVPALIDALTENGQHKDAALLIKAVGQAVESVQQERRDGYITTDTPYHLRLDRRDELFHLLYDLNSMVNVLAQVTSSDNKIEYNLVYHLPNDGGSVYNLKPIQPVRKGRSIEFNGMTGLVLDDTPTDGWVKVLVTNDGNSGEVG